MTEQALLPPPDEPPEVSAVTPKSPRRDLLPWLYGLGFLVLAAAIFYVWQYPGVPGEAPGDASSLQAVEQHLADIDARLAKLEQRPTADIGKITARVDALDGRMADQAQLASRMDTLSGRIESLSGRDQVGLDASKQHFDALNSRIAAVEANAGSLDAVDKRLNRIARIQEASFALASGRPIGDLPNAPEALQRYAHSAPPTEAQLRLRFPAAEQAALAAKQPGDSEAPFVDRVWERAQGLITIRRGDNVVVGNPSAITLSRAQVALDAGDLAGAAAAVETLKGPAGQAMADWVVEANALLSARSALAGMADQA
jgi:hypothetical protein